MFNKQFDTCEGAKWAKIELKQIAFNFRTQNH